MTEKLAVYGMSVVDWLRDSQAQAGVRMSCVLLLTDPDDPQECFLSLVTEEEMRDEDMQTRHGQCLEALALTLAKMAGKKAVLDCVSRAFSMADGCMVCDNAFDELDRRMT